MANTSGQPAVPPHAAGSWSQFLKADLPTLHLTRLTSPEHLVLLRRPLFLDRSALYPQRDLSDRVLCQLGPDPSLLTAPAAEADPERRALLVLKWFLSTLKLQYSSRNEKLGSEKKPLNPFLGELFLATWPKEGDGEELRLVSEQVRCFDSATMQSNY